LAFSNPHDAPAVYAPRVRVEAGIRIEMTVPEGEAGSSFTQRCFAEPEAVVNASRSYRGKVSAN